MRNGLVKQVVPDNRRIACIPGRYLLPDVTDLLFHAFVEAGRQAGYQVTGDYNGEQQEGQIWEAAHVAPRYGVDNLIGIVDHNQFQQFGWRGEDAADRLPPAEPGDLGARFRAFGWRVLEMNGNDMSEVVRVLEEAKQPTGEKQIRTLERRWEAKQSGKALTVRRCRGQYQRAIKVPGGRTRS